ncbi:hypothetical protein D3C81_1553600 [compost metagenome]
MALGVHVAALEGLLGNALAVAVELVVALQQVGGQVPVEGLLAPGHALERFVGKAFGVEIVGRTDAHPAAQCQRLPFVVLGDDIDDAAGSACAIQATGTGHHFDALDARGGDAVELTGNVPAGVLRNTVNQYQHIAPAEGLAVVAHGAG